MKTTFWDRTLFDFSDALNTEIFEKSARVQLKEIGRPSDLGAQQAMVSADVLSWIPDPVGLNCTSSDALLFCGSAYAGIFSPYSARPGQRSMPFEPYAAAKSLKDLQRLYFDRIIDPPGAATGPDVYYGKIEELCRSSVPDSSYIALFDLCRASFVKRVRTNGTVKDMCGDRVIRDACDVFAKYVEADTADEWLWRRLSEGEARRIVALGTVAEHGLLRLFQRSGQSIYLGDLGPLQFPKDMMAPIELQAPNGKWVAHYAYEWLRYKEQPLVEISGALQLDYWLEHSMWWSIRKDGEEVWRLLPVYHPTSLRLTGETLRTTVALIKDVSRQSEQTVEAGPSSPIISSQRDGLVSDAKVQARQI